MAYHQACNTGELRLDPSDAQVLDGKKWRTPFTLSWKWGVPTTLTSISLKYPPNTYILIATYKPKYPQQMARVCQLGTNVITREDAERGFLSGVRQPYVSPNPRMPLEIDRPQEGYEKRLMFFDAGWVVMETGVYKERH
jgi:hypothetical protein